MLCHGERITAGDVSVYLGIIIGYVLVSMLPLVILLLLMLLLVALLWVMLQMAVLLLVMLQR